MSSEPATTLPPYRDLDDRLAEWRRACLVRQGRHAELDQVPDPDYHGRNLAARPGVRVRVDSYLGTINTDRVADAYWPLYEPAVSCQPTAPGCVALQIVVDGPGIAGLRLRRDGGPWQPVGPHTALELAPGATTVEVQAEHALGWCGRPSRLTLRYRPDDTWPAGLTVQEHDNGRVAPSRYPFGYEDHRRPELAELRRRFRLDELVAGAAGDLERMVRIRSWIKSLWEHRLPWRHPPYNGLLILDRASRGVETFICMHYSVALIHACMSLGMQGRLINLHRGIAPTYPIGEESSADPPVDEHVVAEIWCAEHRKWVLMDTDFDYHYERDGVPLSALEIHRAFLAGETDQLVVKAGPGAASYASLGMDERFYRDKLAAYYAHFSIMMRNDFLSNPDGPIPALHLTDERTPPILWYHGEDLRLHPYLLGPMVVATPFSDETLRLTDGNLQTAWASADGPGEHWVEITFPAPTLVQRVVLHWPEWRERYRTSQRYRLEARRGGAWTELMTVEENPERPWTVHDIAPTEVEALRVVQPPGGGFPEHAGRLWLAQVEAF